MDSHSENSTSKILKAIYILNFVGILLPFCILIGVILAYVFREDGDEVLQSHFHYVIRGFWISLLYYIISGILCLLLIGYVLLFVVTLWWIIRNAKGLRLLLNGRAVADPCTWGF